MFTCDICSKTYISNCTLNEHKKNVHNVIREKPVTAFQCLEESCNASFRNNKSLCDHLTEAHLLCIDVQELQFDNIKDFNNWKLDTESQHNFSYVKYYGKKKSKNEVYITYNCNRSGVVNSNCKKYVKADTTA